MPTAAFNLTDSHANTTQVAAPFTVAVRTTLFGASIDGTSASGQTTMLTKWGACAGRQFFTGFDQVAPRKPNLTRLHASWKPSSVTAITDAAVRSACVNLLAGDVVEVWHESDSKINKGTLTFDQAVSLKNAFHDTVKRVRPDLLVANTLTGWEANPKNATTHGNIDRWAGVRADLLGIDCDGIHGWPYPIYDGPIATAVAFVAKFPAYTGWCVPEFGTSRQTADPDGSVRAKWATDHAAKFVTGGAEHVVLYEFNSTVGNSFTTSAELAAWSSLI